LKEVKAKTKDKVGVDLVEIIEKVNYTERVFGLPASTIAAGKKKEQTGNLEFADGVTAESMSKNLNNYLDVAY